jgi:hypothetical protein
VTPDVRGFRVVPFRDRGDWSAVWVILLIVAMIVVGTIVGTADEPPGAQTECQEDESCWDCETMGNGVCGP